MMYFFDCGTETSTLSKDEMNLVKELDITVPETERENAFIGIASAETPKTLYGIRGTVTKSADGTPAEGIEMKLYQGTDISLASPSDAVWTDEGDSYVFDGLENGLCCVEIPTADGYEADSKTVTKYPVVRGGKMSLIVSDLSLFVAANTKQSSGNTGSSGSGSRFYLEADGSMAVSTTTPDGFKVGADGALVR